MMAESIELRSYGKHNAPDGDKEDYDEIKIVADNIDSLENFGLSFSPELIKAHDFFTRLDAKLEPKKNKKKKSKKREIVSNMMDIITMELEFMSIPITENVVQFEESKRIYYNNYVRNYSRYQRKLQFRKTLLDSENGLIRRTLPLKLHPIFPNLLDNLVNDAQCFTKEFIQPITYDDLINNHDLNDRGPSTKFVDVDLKDIDFKHHHKFSLEVLLSVKLVHYYNLYKTIEETLTHLSQDIKVNRETKDNLKRDILKASPNRKDDLRFDATIRKYSGKLLELKEKYIEVFKDKRDVTHKIVSVWSDIEMIREKFGCKDTPYLLNIRKHILNNKEYEKDWNELFHDEYTDRLTKIEYDFTSKCIQYKLSKTDNEKTPKKKITKPKLEINEGKLQDEVSELVENILLKEKIELILEKDKHHNYVAVVRNCYYFKIYLDDVFVCESERYTATNNSLSVSFNESLSIEVLPDNQIIKITLVENNENVAYVKMYLSEIPKYRDHDYSTVEFVYDKSLAPTANHVGSGHSIKEIAAVNKVRLKSSNTFNGNLTTSCSVSIKMKFNENFHESQSEAIKCSWSIGSKLRKLINGIDKPSIELLTEIIGQIYSKDVSNDDNVIKTLNQLCKMKVKSAERFSMDENSPQFIRFKLLHLRNSGGFTNVENKMVPIHGSQISTEQLNCLQKTREKDFDINYLKDKEADMDPIELNRFLASKYMQKLNKKMLQNLNEHLMVKSQKDIVREFRDFSWRNIFSRNKNVNTSGSISNGAKQQILMESIYKEQEIQITVQRAFNLLDRSAGLLDEGQNNEDVIAGYKVRPLRPFVRVSYHSAVAQTVTAIGCQPTWNQTLKFNTRLYPITSLHIDIYDACKVNVSEGTQDDDLGSTVHYRYCNKWLGTVQVPLFAVLSLGALRGIFKINTPPVLFGYDTAQNKQSHSLIPEVTQLMKQDASYITLHVTTGLAHLGGFLEYNQPLPTSVEDDYIIKHLNTFVTDYTNDFPNRNISLTFIDSAGRNKCVTQFLQPIPLPDRECFPRNPKSCGSGLSKSSVVSRSSSSKSSGRKREELEAIEEKELVHSQVNWKGDGLVKTISACLRYVALIPSYDVCDTHVVTLMGLELLKVLLGSALDHTLLLSSYFLYLGIKSWVAIGGGLPRGRSAYVMIQYELTARRFVLTSDTTPMSRGFLRRSEGFLWYVCDAVSGDRHELRDVGCPMKTVDYLFDNENIWVNVQSSQDCENVSFDLFKSSDWQPVFDKSTFVMKQAIATDVSLYHSPRSTESLRRSLEDKIRIKVQKWRPRLKTVWNRYCSSLVRECLPQWEYWAFNPSGPKPAFTHKLKQLMVTYMMFGFPMNVPFTNTKSLVSAVKGAGIHMNDDPYVEFALAVEVYAYPCDVLSVWVFLATLTRG